MAAERIDLLLTNLRAERRNHPKGMAVAYFDYIIDAEGCGAVVGEKLKLDSAPFLDVSITLPKDEQHRFLKLLAELQDYLSTS